MSNNLELKLWHKYKVGLVILPFGKLTFLLDSIHFISHDFQWPTIWDQQ